MDAILQFGYKMGHEYIEFLYFRETVCGIIIGITLILLLSLVYKATKN